MENMELSGDNIYPRVILGLDISTSCIGVSILEDKGDGNVPSIITITHKQPKIPKKINGIEALCLRKFGFNEGFLKNISEYTDKKITDVVIEEPLLSSNNINTVATLLRFNGMIADAVYNTLGVVPNFISSYDARMFSFPELVTVRKFNKVGKIYDIEHVKKALSNKNIVLFGSYPFDIDKKSVMMNAVNDLYCGENSVPWEYGKNGELKKENYDACDALICSMAYININRYGIEKPRLSNYKINENENEYIIDYTTEIWDKKFNKKLTIPKNDIN